MRQVFIVRQERRLPREVGRVGWTEVVNTISRCLGGERSSTPIPDHQTQRTHCPSPAYAPTESDILIEFKLFSASNMDNLR